MTDRTKHLAKNKGMWRQSLRRCRVVLNLPETEDEAEVQHMKWTKFYATLPQHTPPNFIPWVHPSQRPQVQDNLSQAQQGETSQEPAADWDGILLPPRSDRRRKRRAVTGEGTSASADDHGNQDSGASRADIEQILRGVQGLQLGFDNFNPSLQRIDAMNGRVENIEHQFQELRTDFDQHRHQFQDLRTEFDQYRQQSDERYQEFHTYHDQQQAWQQQYQEQQTNWQQQYQQQFQTFQTGFDQYAQQQQANFEQLTGNFYETRHYEREILRRDLTALQLEQFQAEAEDLRMQQHWHRGRPRANPDPSVDHEHDGL